MPARHKFISMTFKEKYTHRPTVWVLPFDLLNPNFMSYIKNKIFKTIQKPKIYVCYIDDIVIVTQSQTN